MAVSRISEPIPYYDPTGEPSPLDTLPSISDALALLRTFERDHVAELPPNAGAGLAAAVVMISPVDAIVNGGEALYAAHKQGLLSGDGSVVCGQEISYATDNGWHDLANGRGQGIVQAIRRDLGEAPVGPPWPLPENDPIPLGQYMEPVDPPAPLSVNAPGTAKSPPPAKAVSTSKKKRSGAGDAK